MNRSPSDLQRRASTGRWFMALTGLSLVAIGTLFILLMARSSLRAKAMHDWPEVPCLILTSMVEERRHDPYSPPEYRHRVEFGYEWSGKARTSERYSLRGGKWSSQRIKAQRLVQLLPAGSRQTCRVNPEQPDIAVLKVDSLAPLYSIWFPSLFVIGGIGILVRCMRTRRPGAVESG